MFLSSTELESGIGMRGEIVEESFHSVVNLNDLEYLGMYLGSHFSRSCLLIVVEMHNLLDA